MQEILNRYPSVIEQMDDDRRTGFLHACNYNSLKVV